MEVVCSAAAGVVARLLCHPLDTIKTVSFTGFAGEHRTASGGGAGAPLAAAAEKPLHAPPPRLSISRASRAIWAREGVAGFYRGVGVAALGSAPGVALYLGTYHRCIRIWGTFDDPDGLLWGGVAAELAIGDGGSAPARFFRTALAATPANVRFFVSGLVAEAISCLVWVPIDVAKERLQSQPPSLVGRYTDSWDALRRILVVEGVRGLYKGYVSTLASFGPFSAVYFVCYEYGTATLTRWLLRDRPADTASSLHRDARDVLPSSSTRFAVALGAGAGGNVVASLCTNPLELVKTRLQVQRAILQGRGASASGPSVTPILKAPLYTYHYAGLWVGLSTLAKEEGFCALWRGVGSRIAYTAPNAAFTMGFFELLKSLLI